MFKITTQKFQVWNWWDLFWGVIWKATLRLRKMDLWMSHYHLDSSLMNFEAWSARHCEGHICKFSGLMVIWLTKRTSFETLPPWLTHLILASNTFTHFNQPCQLCCCNQVFTMEKRIPERTMVSSVEWSCTFLWGAVFGVDWYHTKLNFNRCSHQAIWSVMPLRIILALHFASSHREQLKCQERNNGYVQQAQIISSFKMHATSILRLFSSSIDSNLPFIMLQVANSLRCATWVMPHTLPFSDKMTNLWSWLLSVLCLQNGMQTVI